VLRGNFLIERALRRRLLVVVFPGCHAADGSPLPGFSSALLQPAVALGCTITSAAIAYRSDGAQLRGRLGPLLRSFGVSATIAFGGPTFRIGSRKEIGRQLLRELNT
jgi:hypothetical protein